MDDVDGLIVSNLKVLKCDISEEVARVGDLTSENVFEAVVRCLWLICPNVQIESCRLPPSMTARFRLSSTIASAVQALGYKGEVGYQTILYGSEVEIRRLLIFLIERLPKEVDRTVDISSDNKLNQLKRNVGAEIRRQLEESWIPWYCRRLGYVREGRFWKPPHDGPETVGFSSLDVDIRPVTLISQLLPSSSVDTFRNIPASLLCQFTGHQKHSVNFSRLLRLAEYIGSVGTARSVPHRVTRPKLPPKPTLLPKPSEFKQSLASVTAETNISNPPSEDSAQDQDIVQLKNAIDTLTSELTDENYRIEELTRQRLELDRTLAALQASKETLDRDVIKREKSVELIPNCAEVVEKLQEYLIGSSVRMEELQSQWYDVKRPLENELRELQATQIQKSPVQVLQETIDDLRLKLSEADAESASKSRLVLKLETELQSVDKKVARSYFTKRILEIVANIKKQQDQIDKIINDTRAAQREITSLSGKLERTFIAADELIFNDAKQDETVRRVYKQVVSIHEMCADMIKAHEAVGGIRREVRDMEDTVDSDRSRSIDVSLEKVLTDYLSIRQENESLQQRINHLMQ